MSDIRVRCGDCRSMLLVRDHLAGKRIRCPKCQAEITAVSIEKSAEPGLAAHGDLGGFFDAAEEAIPVVTYEAASPVAPSSKAVSQPQVDRGGAPVLANRQSLEQGRSLSYPQGKYTRTDSRSYVVDQVLDVCRAAARGKAAGSIWRWRVLAYRADYVVGILLGTSVVAGGIAAMRSSNNVLLASAVAVGAGALSIAKELFKRFRIEEQAREALGVKDVFEKIQINIIASLQQQDPNDSLTQLNKEANIALGKHHATLPESADAFDEEGRLLAAKLVDTYCERWVVRHVPRGGRYAPEEKPDVTSTFNLTARFQSDPQGRPAFEDESQNGEVFRTYLINLILDPAGTAPSIERVTFLLDDSYYDPLLEAVKRDGLFQHEMESYGDFTLLAKVQVGDNTFAQTGYLSELLRRGHARDMTPAIQEAIKRIEDN